MSLGIGGRQATQFFLWRQPRCVAIALALLSGGPSLRAVPESPLINGSFEDGVTGWEFSFTGSYAWRSDAPWKPLDPHSVPEIWSALASGVRCFSSDSYFQVYDGGFALGLSPKEYILPFDIHLADGTPGMWFRKGLSVSLSQTIQVTTESVISGWASFTTSDYPPFNNDRASVRVNGAELWGRSVLDAFIDNDWMRRKPEVWEPWSITVAPGCYTISLSVSGDDFMSSYGSFDAITVCPVPDSTSTAALSCCLFASVAFLRHRFKV